MIINEKLMLFLLATFVAFVGIVDSVINDTKASEVVIDEQEINITAQYDEVDTSDVEKLTGVLSYTVDNCLSSVEISDGIIEFKSEITEYWVEVSNFEQLKVYPLLNSDAFGYTVEKFDEGQEKKIVITVNDQNNNVKKYTIYITESLL